MWFKILKYGWLKDELDKKYFMLSLFVRKMSFLELSIATSSKTTCGLSFCPLKSLYLKELKLSVKYRTGVDNIWYDMHNIRFYTIQHLMYHYIPYTIV